MVTAHGDGGFVRGCVRARRDPRHRQFSMGGGIGVHYAIWDPDKVRRLVTIGGIDTNVLSPGPCEGSMPLQEFTENPTHQRLIDCRPD